MTILELREKRNKTWEAAKAFLDTHRSENGTLSAEDDATYTRMEQEIEDYGREIARLERQAALDAELAKPVGEPIKNAPVGTAPEKKGRASDEYKKNFWNALRMKNPERSVINALQEDTDTEGGYLVPEEYERTLIDGLHENNIFRELAKIVHTGGERKIPVVASHGTASWLDEEGAYTESDDSFGQITLGAYKLGTMIKVSEELLHDSVFDLESYISAEFSRRMGNAEEDAFLNGNGTGKPTGILNASGGAQVGVTSAAAAAITCDELISLYHSLAVPYRKNAAWLMNDSTVQAIRKLKDHNDQYLWQPSLVAGTPDTILGVPVKVSRYMPEIAAGNKTIAFGDFNYYWIADREGISFLRLDELFRTTGQIGFRGSKRVDGKLILPEAIQVLKQKAS